MCDSLVSTLPKLSYPPGGWFDHYSDIIIGAMASQITSLIIAYSTDYWGADQRKHQSSASLAFCGEFTDDRWPMNSPHKWPVMRKIFSFHDVIILCFLSFVILLYMMLWSLSRTYQRGTRVSCFAGRQNAVQCCFQTRKNTCSGKIRGVKPTKKFESILW